MKYILSVLLIVVSSLIGYGYMLKNSGDHINGDKWVGVGILTGAFVLMPVFIYHRWKDRKVKDYMLTEENLKKMREFTVEKKNKK